MDNTRMRFFKTKSSIDLKELITPQSVEGRLKCRVLYGENIQKISYEHYSVRKIQSLKLINCNNIDYSFKSTNREKINALFALREKYDDILIIKNGLITDTSIANTALYNGNQWLTPEAPLLKGTQREYLLDKGIIKEYKLYAKDIFSFKEIALFNAMIPFREITLPVNKENILNFEAG